MLALDEAALNERFSANIDVEQFQVLVENQPDEAVDSTRIYCRWFIEPGSSELVQSDNTHHQLGTAVFQIIAPKETWTDDADALRDQFLALFRRWRSPDHCLRVYKMESSKPRQDDCYQLNCKVFWESYRRP
ncbi:hypothetical protein ASF00_09340 [Sphingomonas sp. Leaf34]|uniref:hypothetical protein n=1 Tax=Sphingomonas sp. Leaf34 TaxID=1736216 RepID=UPI0006F5312C|nr:hypothetical protein [Sphingomonas sp. Leaf34]KQN28102.1 hypothetical protein ASF00_09340 [Sphingomonas sp. Leaf34]